MCTQRLIRSLAFSVQGSGPQPRGATEYRPRVSEANPGIGARPTPSPDGGDGSTRPEGHERIERFRAAKGTEVN